LKNFFSLSLFLVNFIYWTQNFLKSQDLILPIFKVNSGVLLAKQNTKYNIFWGNFSNGYFYNLNGVYYGSQDLNYLIVFKLPFSALVYKEK